MDANDLIKSRYKKKANWDQNLPEGISDIDSINDTKSLHNHSQFNTKGGYNTNLTAQGSVDSVKDDGTNS